MASKAEIEMLRAGAQKIAAAMELGLSEGELMDLLSRQSKQSAGIVARGRDDSGSFRFSPAFGSGEFKRQGKQLRPASERMARRDRKNPGKKAGAAAQRPEEVSERFVNAVIAKLQQQGKEVNQDEVFRIIRDVNEIPGTEKEVKNQLNSEMEAAGFRNPDDYGYADDSQGVAKIDSSKATTEVGPALRKLEQEAKEKELLAKVGSAFTDPKKRQFAYARLPYVEAPREVGMRRERINAEGTFFDDPDAKVNRVDLDPAPARMGVTGSDGFTRKGPINQTVADLAMAVQQGQIKLDDVIGVHKRGPAAGQPKTVRDLMDDLEMQADPKLQVQAERSQGRDAVLQSARFSPEVRDSNASQFKRELQQRVYDSGMEPEPFANEMALRNLENINIEDTVSPVDDFGRRVLSGRDAMRGVLADTPVVVSGPNTPNTAQNLNAPQNLTASQFVNNQVQALGNAEIFRNQQIGEIRELGAPLSDFDQRISNLAGQEIKRRGQAVTPFDQAFVDSIGPIRSIEALQKASDAILRVGGEAGLTFPSRVMDEETGKVKAQKVDRPGLSEVMDFLKMNRGDQQRFGLALQVADQGGQLGYQGRRRSEFGPEIATNINIGGTGKDLETPVARRTGGRFRRQQGEMKGPEGVGAPSQDARMPFIGATEAEGEAYYRGVPGNVPPGVSIEQFITERDLATGRSEEQIERNLENARIVAERARRGRKDASPQNERGVVSYGQEDPREPGIAGTSDEERRKQLIDYERRIRRIGG
jgi:hypothetical protein